MAENPGSEVLFLDDGLAISEGSVSAGGDVVLYGPEVGRGESTPAPDQDALMIQDGVAQTGPGLTAEVVISDSQGETSGPLTLISRDSTVEDYCGYDTSPNSCIGPITDEMLSVNYTSFLLYENANTGELSFGWIHDEVESGGGGQIYFDVDGLPDGTTTVVEDDPGDQFADQYDLTPPTGHIENNWGDGNTDGVIMGKFTSEELSGVTVTAEVSTYRDGNNGEAPPDYVRFIGDDGTSVERPYDGTNTTVEITF